MPTERLCDGQVEKLLRAVADGDVEMVSLLLHELPGPLFLLELSSFCFE